MHAFSIVTIGIFVAGYATARWDLTTCLYELAIFAWDYGVVVRAAKAFALLSVLFLVLVLPIARIAVQVTDLVSNNEERAANTRLISPAPKACRWWYICTRAAQASRLLLVG